MYEDPAVQRSTMMGLPCVRLDGRFFASLDRRTEALLVKLPRERVRQLIDSGQGEPFAPAGRVFREWVAVPTPDRRRWKGLLAEAKTAAATVQVDAGAARGSTSIADGAGGFTGFGPAGLGFLAGLQRDNSRTYFDAHRDVYRRELLEPSKLLVTDLGERLRAQISTGLQAEPRVGGSLFRIANDLRFGRGKPPYKAYLDLAFWEGDSGPRSDPSLILRITPTEVHLGAGVFTLAGAALDRYRAALHDTAEAGALDAEADRLLAAGATLSDVTRRRPPARLAVDGPGGRFALRDGFHLVRVYPRPAAVTSARLVPWCTQRLAEFGTIHRWLVRHTT